MLCPIALCWIKWTWVWLLHDALRNIFRGCCRCCHYSDVIMSPIASPIASLTIVYSTVYSDADQRKHQSPASLAFVRGIHRRPVNHKWPVTRENVSTWWRHHGGCRCVSMLSGHLQRQYWMCWSISNRYMSYHTRSTATLLHHKRGIILIADQTSFLFSKQNDILEMLLKHLRIMILTLTHWPSDAYMRQQTMQ